MSDPTETVFSPPTVYWGPAVDYPPQMRAAIDQYETAHEAWRTAFADLHAAEAAVEPAKARDAQALIDAVAAGKGHPGAKQETAAKQAFAIANEKTRVARLDATGATDALKAVLTESTAELLPLVTASIRAAADAYDAAQTECKTRMDQAASNLRDASAGISMLRKGIQADYGIETNYSPLIEAPTWPAYPTSSARFGVDRLEQMVREASTAKVG
jgi:hypothetical protein